MGFVSQSLAQRGNLLQRTRCSYFYDTNTPCNKRSPNSGCSAIGGYSRQLGIIGVSDKCIATFPGDMAVGMRVLDAVVETVDAEGQRRSIPIADFHRLWGDSPQQDTVLKPGELVTAVILPRPLGGSTSTRRCATGPPMPMLWSRSPPSSSRTALAVLPSAASRLSRGAWKKPKAAPSRRRCCHGSRLPGCDADPGQCLQAAARHPRAGSGHRASQGLSP